PGRRSRQGRAAFRSGRQPRPRRRCGCCTCGLCPFGLATGVVAELFSTTRERLPYPTDGAQAVYIGPLPTRDRVLPRTRPGPPHCDPGLLPIPGPTGDRPTDPGHAPGGRTPPAETPAP